MAFSSTMRLVTIGLVLFLVVLHPSVVNVQGGGSFLRCKMCGGAIAVTCFFGKQDKPSKNCCRAMKMGDLTCICTTLIPSLEAFTNVTRLVEIAAICDNPIPSGTQCGSYSVP